MPVENASVSLESQVESFHHSTGADVTSDLLDWDKARADPRLLAALTGKIQA
jgi:hypothetical protein